MFSKFQRRHASSETVMLYRFFVQEDKTSIEREKAEAEAGKSEYKTMLFSLLLNISYAIKKIFTIVAWSSPDTMAPPRCMEHSAQSESLYVLQGMGV